MKNTTLFLAIVLLLGACKDKMYQKYLANVPVYTSYETFRSSGGFESPRAIDKMGNIYFKDNYLFVVEPDKGIHFIDNTNPSAPIQKGFLNVWGAGNMAIKGNYLYVNSYIDLLVYDISSMENPTLTRRMEDVFPTALPTSNSDYPYAAIDKSKGVVTSWIVEEVNEEVTPYSPTYFEDGGIVAFNETSGAPSISATGIAGSISLFTIVGDYLYVMEEGNLLHPFDLTNPASPVTHERVNVWGTEVETLFPYQDYLFMGTPSGIQIFGTTNPKSPNHLSTFDHGRGCDPVVVKDDYAYVTVRSGGACGGVINQLDVINVSNKSNPTLISSFEMTNPHGLGIDDNLLFICDGAAGLKVFDATNPSESGNHLLYSFPSVQVTDIIPFNNVAMVIGTDGIYQYDYSVPGEFNLLSVIPF